MARKKSKVRSKAQAELAADLERWFPFSRIRQEVYIGELIEARGYSMEEIGRELGNRPHRLFCDILLSDSDGDCAFEYHGEQHYHQIGGMTDTMLELNLNQHLDQEKSWILERIGIPLVSIPYDTYVDLSVVMRMMEEASESLGEAQAKLYVCDTCGRRFPANRLTGGMCQRCVENENRRAEARFEAERLAGRAMTETELEPDDPDWDGMTDAGDDDTVWEDDGTDADTDDQFDDDAGDDAEDWAEARKREQRERAKAMRKAAYQRWKESPEYQRRKEEQRAARRAAYQEAKRRREEAKRADGE